jgi:dimethylhistidine N-methyltransferase
MNDFPLQDFSPSKQQFFRDVLDGLAGPHKSLPCKYFYDNRGSELFDQICELDEYYLTRTELTIMQQFAPEMAELLGTGCMLVEFGSGSSLKTEILLQHLRQPVAYLPVDISRDHLRETSRRLAEQYPLLEVKPVCADFTKSFELPHIEPSRAHKIVYFPGSTIGNFGPTEALRLLQTIADLTSRTGGLLIGYDLKKSHTILEPAYNDAAGITAAFNLNLLVRINRELDADFSVDQFRHRAFFNEPESRIEMHLVSETDQTVRIGNTKINIGRDESIHTENSYKYSQQYFGEIAARAGFKVLRTWTDPQGLFCVQYLIVSS